MPPPNSGGPSRRAGGRRRPRPHSLFGLTARLELWQAAGIATLVFVGLLALWWLATAGGWVGPLFLPSPVAVHAKPVPAFLTAGPRCCRLFTQPSLHPMWSRGTRWSSSR